MFKIGEFSKLTKVSVRMLRYYDEEGLLKPAKIDPFTGYRLYSTDQIPVLQRILMLRNMGFHIAEIAAFLEQWDTGSVIGLLEEKKKEILRMVEAEQRRIRKIEMAVRDMESNKIDVHYNVIIKKVPSYKILSLRERIPDYFCEGTLWERLYAFLEQERPELLPGVNNVAIFHDEGETDCGVDVEVGVLVRKMGRDRDGFVYRETEDAETMACLMVYGRYENIGAAYHSFACWLEEHRQYEMDGPTRQICHIGPYNEDDPENYLTEVQTPVRLRI